MMKPNPALALALFFPLAACDDNGSASGPIPADQLYESLAGAYCDVLRSCTFDTEDITLVSLLARATTAANCKSTLMQIIPRDVDVEAEVAAGRYTYDAALFETCLSTLRSRCTLGSLDECRDVLHGKVTVGAACQHGEDCEGDAWCDMTSAACGGTCKARVALGEACTSGNACSFAAGPAECDYDSGKCLGVAYQKDAAEGAPCGDVTSGSTVTRVTCTAGLACRYNGADDQQKCTATLASGASCAGEGLPPCALGEVCFGPSTGAAKCTPFGIANKVGDACDLTETATAPVACNALAGLACVDKKCVAMGDGSVGTRCANDFEFGSPCKSGLFCGEDGTCQNQLDDGADCDRNTQCKSDYCANLKCAEPVCGGS